MLYKTDVSFRVDRLLCFSSGASPQLMLCVLFILFSVSLSTPTLTKDLQGEFLKKMLEKILQEIDKKGEFDQTKAHRRYSYGARAPGVMT